MTIEAQVVPDLQFIPTSYAATRRGRIVPLYPADHAILCRLQSGPALPEELLAVSGVEHLRALSVVVSRLRRKIAPLDLTILPANRLNGHYALRRFGR
jgi:DNA-binding response OmpR family regulator